MSEQKSIITELQCGALTDLCYMTHFDPPSAGGPEGKFHTLVGLELRHPEDPIAQGEFAFLALQLTVQGVRFIAVDVPNGLHVMYCPGRPCPQPTPGVR